VEYANKNGIPTGPGRGSAAGALVSFLVGITKIDPLEHNLMFER
jgi:DNA polymerase-3 subunit alpha